VVPESPRWLLSRNRIDEAEQIVQRMAQVNKKTLPPNYLHSLQVLITAINGWPPLIFLSNPQEAIDQKKKNVLLEQQPPADSDGASPAALEEGQTEKPASKGTMTELLRYPNMRRKFYILTFLWLANSVAYNGLSYNSSNLGVSDALAFFINAIVEAPAYVMTWWAMGRWGRRWPVSITMLIGGLACCACMFVPEG